MRGEHPWTISGSLASWYLVASSKELGEGAVSQAVVGEREVVLYRSEGVVSALDPHCAHMGAKLCQGKVRNGLLTCPLHGWQYGPDGKLAGGRERLRSWPVLERMGGIFVYNGPAPLYQPPEEMTDYHWSAVAPAEVDSPWYALTANAFDTHHYEAVHRRRLLEPAQVEQPDPWRFRCSYLSEPTGGHASDRLMRYLSPKGIRVTMTCFGGTVFTVRSEVGSRKAALVVGMEPRGDTTRLRLLVGSQGRGVTALMARYLYTSFLKSDLKPMTGIRLQPYTGLEVDRTIERFARYLESLPEAEE